PGLRQQERSDAHGADPPASESPAPNPADQLAVATDIVDIACSRDDQRVDRVSIERTDWRGHDTHAVGGHDESAVDRMDRTLVNERCPKMVRMRRRDSQRFHWSREIQQGDALVRNESHTEGGGAWHVTSLAEFQGSLSFLPAPVKRKLETVGADRQS